MSEKRIFQPVRPSSEFFIGRREATKNLGLQILGVLPHLSDTEFGIDRRGEIADYLSVSASRVEYITTVLKKEGHIYVHKGRIVGYYSVENRTNSKDE
jgi:hypothetical protein